jgi:hypothetical protein
MKAKSIITGAVAVLIAVGMVFIYSSSFAGKTRVASLTNVKGSVMVKKAGSTAWVAGTDRMEIKESDELKTEAGSSAIIKMDDGSMVKLGPLAKMKMDQLTASGNDNKTSLDISIGKSWNRASRLTKDAAFNVKTPTAVAGVRGTFFASEVDKTSDSTFDVYDGSVKVSAASDPNAAVTVEAHNRTTVAANGKPTAPTRMPSADEKSGRASFTEEEYTSASFDLQIGVNPQVVDAGKTAMLSVQVYKNGQPFHKEIKVGLGLSGAATFVSTGTNDIEATTDSNGALTLEITSPEKETVTVSAQMMIKVEKK